MVKKYNFKFKLYVSLHLNLKLNFNPYTFIIKINLISIKTEMFFIFLSYTKKINKKVVIFTNDLIIL